MNATTQQATDFKSLGTVQGRDATAGGSRLSGRRQ
jgi:hypothetical protein